MVEDDEHLEKCTKCGKKRVLNIGHGRYGQTCLNCGAWTSANLLDDQRSGW